MNTVYRYPLRISPTAAETLRLWSCACRYLWNRSLRLRDGLYKRYKIDISYMGGKRPDGTKIDGLNKRLTKLRSKYEWLNAIPCIAAQQTIRDLDTAFTNFYRRVKRGETPGYPKFKRRGMLPRLYFPHQMFSIDIDDQGRHYAKLPKLPLIRIDVDRPYLEHPSDKLISCSVVFDRMWYICILVEKPDPTPIKRGLPAVGINRGVVNTVALSNGGGYQIDTDKLKLLEDRKAVLQKRLAIKIGSKKGQPKSGHWLRLKHQIDGYDHRMADIRCNFNHQTSRSLVDQYDRIAIEKFDIKGMTESAKGTVEQPGVNVELKARFNRDNLRNGWYQLSNMTKYKSFRLGAEFLEVDSHHITQQCSSCGHIDEGNVNKLTRTFKCLKCGFVEDMDKNAATNVLTRSK